MERLESVSLRSMSKLRTCVEMRTTALVAAAAALLFAAELKAQVPVVVAGAPAGLAPTRSCSANPVLAPLHTKRSARKLKHAIPPEPAPTCVEVKGEGIEVQEFLQTTARLETWRIGENRASEDSWSFVRYFDPEELEKYSDTKVLLEPVKFTSGKAAVTVRTTDLSDGYSRVQISARFIGEGSSTDKTWGQPTSVWALNSRGVLEQEIVTNLQTRYKPVQ